MAVGTPVLATPNVSVTGASIATASFSPTAGDLLLATVYIRGGGTSPTLTDDLGSTWNVITALDAVNGNARVKVFWQVAAGGARVATATTTSNTQIGLSIVAIPLGAVHSSNIQIGTSATGDPAVTMASYGGTSICVGGHVGNAGSTVTSPSGFTELFDAALGTNNRGSFSYDMVSPTTSLTWVSTSTDSLGWGIEIIEATTDQTITGALFTNTNQFFGSTWTVDQKITGARFDNVNQFFSGTFRAEQTITGARFNNTNTFFGGTFTVQQTIAGTLFTNSNSFFASSWSTAAADQTINGALFVNPNTFFTGVVSPGAVTISGTRFDNVNQFFTSSWLGNSTITGTRFDNTNQFFTSVISAGSVSINGTRFDNVNQFFNSNWFSAQFINGSLFQNSNTFFSSSWTVDGGGVPNPGGPGRENDWVLRWRRRRRR